jgi:hypothetical protein
MFIAGLFIVCWRTGRQHSEERHKMKFNHDPDSDPSRDEIMDQVYRQAFADVLFEMAQDCLCCKCSTFLENAAIDRYKTMMAKRRQDVATLQTKVEKEKAVEKRRHELEKQNQRNSPKGNDDE